MGKRLAVLALLGGLLIAPPAAISAAPRPSTSATGSIGIQLVGETTPSSVDPLARSYIVGRLAPGTRIRRRVAISNTTSAAVDVAVYAGAATVRGGDFEFAAAHSQNELSRWTSLQLPVVHLRAGATALDTVLIRVPREASRGNRYAVVWAAVSTRAPAGGGETLVNRVGVRMYLSIGRGGAPPASFHIGAPTATRAATGVPIISASVRNTGQRTLAISGTLSLSRGPGGLRAGPFAIKQEPALTAGASQSVIVPLDRRLPRGPWRARLRLTSGNLTRTAVATIRFPGAASPARPPATAPRAGPGSALPLDLTIALVSLPLAAASLLYVCRHATGTRRSARWRAPPSEHDAVH